MEALVYENSPLAEYLQGKFDLNPPRGSSKVSFVVTSGEGEHDANWPVQETEHSDDFSDSTAADFAPRGASKFQERIRNKLPKPLDQKVLRQRATLGKLYDACTV